MKVCKKVLKSSFKCFGSSFAFDFVFPNNKKFERRKKR